MQALAWLLTGWWQESDEDAFTINSVPSYTNLDRLRRGKCCSVPMGRHKLKICGFICYRAYYAYMGHPHTLGIKLQKTNLHYIRIDT